MQKKLSSERVIDLLTQTYKFTKQLTLRLSVTFYFVAGVNFADCCINS